MCLLCVEKKRERSVLFKASSVGGSGRNGTRGIREVEDTFLAPQNGKVVQLQMHGCSQVRY